MVLISGEDSSHSSRLVDFGKILTTKLDKVFNWLPTKVVQTQVGSRNADWYQWGPVRVKICCSGTPQGAGFASHSCGLIPIGVLWDNSDLGAKLIEGETPLVGKLSV
jgi:hypothetical protein